MLPNSYLVMGKDADGNPKFVELVDSGETTDNGTPIWQLATNSSSALSLIGTADDDIATGDKTVIGYLKGIYDRLAP